MTLNKEEAMWILDSMSQIPFKRPFLVLTVTLGAGFLLLAFLTGLSGFDSLDGPWIYAILATGFAIAFMRKPGFRLLLILSSGSLLLSLVLLPQHLLLFSFIFMGMVSRLVASEHFRIWKWLCASILFYLTAYMIVIWQTLLLTTGVLPAVAVPAAQGALFGFLAYCSFLPFLLRKDRVLEAFDHYGWQSQSEGATLARQIKDVYLNAGNSLKNRNADPHSTEELEDFTERMIHLCFRLQQVAEELSPDHTLRLNRQIEEVQEMIESVLDPVAKVRYEQTLENRQKQRDYYEDLQSRFERMRSQLLSFQSSMENLSFLYANQEIRSVGTDADPVSLFLDLAKARAENV